MIDPVESGLAAYILSKRAREQEAKASDWPRGRRPKGRDTRVWAARVWRDGDVYTRTWTYHRT